MPRRHVLESQSQKWDAHLEMEVQSELLEKEEGSATEASAKGRRDPAWQPFVIVVDLKHHDLLEPTVRAALRVPRRADPRHQVTRSIRLRVPQRYLIYH